MNTKNYLRLIICLTPFIIFFSSSNAFGQDTTRRQLPMEERLKAPFGTLAKMKVEIVDGDELRLKAQQGSYLFRVKMIDSLRLSQPVIIEFKDETGHFPAEDFSLYKYVYGKEAGTLTETQIKKMKNKYVGKEFDIIAYETGEFTGMPKGYSKYQPERQDYSFHFRNYIIVIADLTNK